MEVLRWILAGGVMVGLLVLIHELGHFLAARLFGVGTPVFSIGIGPRVLTLFKWKDTHFVISALPIGGYVQMAGADPFGDEDPELAVEPERDFMRKPVWQRLIIMVAGPAMNLVLPFVLFTAVLMGGEPQLDSSIGTVIPGRTFEQVGIRPGDEVVEAAGVPVDTWVELVRVLDDHSDAPVPLKVERDGQVLSVVLPAGSVRYTKDGRVDTEAMGAWQSRRSSRIGVSDPTSPAWRAGLRVGDAIVEVDGRKLTTFEELREALAEEVPHDLLVARVGKDGKVTEQKLRLEPDPSWQPAPTETDPDRWGIVHLGVFVGYVLPDSAADRAGVKAGDRLVAIDGERIRSWSDVLGLVARTVDPPKAAEAAERARGCGGERPAEAVTRPLVLEIVRDGEPMRLEFAPKFERELVNGLPNFRPIMGIRQYPDAYVNGPEIEKHYALDQAIGRAVEECGLLFKQTFAVLSRLLTQDIGVTEGLGGPISIFRAAGDAASQGLFTFVRMMGMISLSLGIVNLLPVPVLDGGQILFYAIEGIRGRPLPLALRERIQMIGILLLGALLVVVSAAEVSDIFKG